MSLALFHKGTLAVDRSGLDIREYANEHTFIPCNVRKFYVSGDKRIAIVYSGPEIDFSSKDWSNQLKVFKTVITKSNKTGNTDDISCYIQDLYKNTCFFMMTKTACYELVRVTEDAIFKTSCGYLHPLRYDDYSFIGSGLDHAQFLTAVNPNLSIDEIFQTVSRYVIGMWSTEIDSISMDDLKPF